MPEFRCTQNDSLVVVGGMLSSFGKGDEERGRGKQHKQRKE